MASFFYAVGVARCWFRGGLEQMIRMPRKLKFFYDLLELIGETDRSMVLFLILNVCNQCWSVFCRDSKRPVSLLPECEVRENFLSFDPR